MLQQETNRPASEIYEITHLVAEITGLPSTIHGVMFDSAVTWFGRYIENKLADVGKDGKPKHDLESLLATRKENTQRFIDAMKSMGLYKKG